MLTENELKIELVVGIHGRAVRYRASDALLIIDIDGPERKGETLDG